MSRCTGHCCRAFTIGDKLTYAELKVKYEKSVNGESKLPALEEIFPYLIDLGMKTHNPGGEKIDQPTQYFTCRNLSADGNCEIYEQRPQICRNYPELTTPDGQCEFPGCTRQSECENEKACSVVGVK